MAANDKGTRAYEPPRLYDIGDSDERALGATGCGGGAGDTVGSCGGGNNNQGSGCGGGNKNRTGRCGGGNSPGRAYRRR
ncbi:MAG: hypothetical protein MZV49_26325 [Rhodopseudomonas palustris]|nr:hypothetical protein [Rhodopseudomonas palustris]